MDFVTIAQTYIDPGMMVVVLALWFIGYAFKQVPKIPNWSIVFIIIFIGIIAGLFVVGPNVNGVIQGVLAASLAVLGHQTVKQTANAAEEIKKE